MPLTDEQKASLWALDGSPVQGLNVVAARPGTGKTTTVTQYCIDVADSWTSHYAPWQGMAVLSYTNVAKDELQQKLRERGTANALLGHPHFVGTIDAFLNQYLFLPFAAPHMGHEGRPRLVGEPHGPWRVPDDLTAVPANTSSALFFDCYSLSQDGRPIVVDRVPRKITYQHSKAATEPTQANIPKILRMKQLGWERGMATQSDANYLAYKILAESPLLTRSLARRFPLIVIDEAQDMTAVQHALLDHLIGAGLRHAVLVGDEYQAIYEWNTAKPALFTARKAADGWRPAALSETFRCSPAVCATLDQMAPARDDTKMTAAGKNARYPDTVQVVPYDPQNQEAEVVTAINDLAKTLSGREPHSGDHLKSIAILARSRENVALMQSYFTGATTRASRPATWENNLTKDYLRVVNYLTRHDLYRAFTSYEALLMRIDGHPSRTELSEALAARAGVGSLGPLEYRKTLMADLKTIEITIPLAGAATVSVCAACCDVRLTAVTPAVMNEFRKDCRSFARLAKQDQDKHVSSLFNGREERTEFVHPVFPDVRLIFSTVHGVKGETHDGVLFYLKDKSDACGCPSRSTNVWTKILDHDLGQCEHKRIVYVALSRTAQALRIVVPATAANAWQSLL